MIDVEGDETKLLGAPLPLPDRVRGSCAETQPEVVGADAARSPMATLRAHGWSVGRDDGRAGVAFPMR